MIGGATIGQTALGGLLEDPGAIVDPVARNPFKVVVAGVNMQAYIESTIEVEERLGEGASAKFQLIDPPNQPKEGERVEIYWFSFLLFAGRINRTDYTRGLESDASRIVTCECRDLTTVLERHILNRSFADKTTLLIVQDVLSTELAQEGIGIGIFDAAGITWELLDPKGGRILEVFQDLASNAGQVFFMDFDGSVNFLGTTLKPAPRPKITAVPPTTDGLVLWLKAEDLSLNDDDPVASWADASGNGHDAGQATASLRPVFKENILNGHPVVRFDGADDFLTGSLSAAPSAHTVFVAFVPRESDPGFLLGLFKFGTTENYQQGLGTVRDVDGTNYLYSSHGAAVGRAVRIPCPVDDPAVVSRRWTGGLEAADMQLWRNGLEASEKFLSPVGSGFFATYTLAAQDTDFGFGGFHEVDIAEVLVYDRALSNQELDYVQFYLGVKYGTAKERSPIETKVVNQVSIVEDLEGYINKITVRVTGTPAADETPEVFEQTRLEQDEINARKAVEGGSGIHETFQAVTHPSSNDPNVLGRYGVTLARARLQVAAFARRTLKLGSVNTWGWRVGQGITVDLPKFEVFGQWVVTVVEASERAREHLEYKLELAPTGLQQRDYEVWLKMVQAQRAVIAAPGEQLFDNVVTFSSDTTWDVPGSGLIELEITTKGAGAGGGEGFNNIQHFSQVRPTGGSGGRAVRFVAIQAGTTLTIKVGAGGQRGDDQPGGSSGAGKTFDQCCSAGTCPVSGADGGLSQVDDAGAILCLAEGGQKGTPETCVNGFITQAQVGPDGGGTGDFVIEGGGGAGGLGGHGKAFTTSYTPGQDGEDGLVEIRY